jgi:hypothetical protein
MGCTNSKVIEQVESSYKKRSLNNLQTNIPINNIWHHNFIDYTLDKNTENSQELKNTYRVQKRLGL